MITIDSKEILTNGIIKKLNILCKKFNLCQPILEFDINIDDLCTDNWMEIIKYIDFDDIFNIRNVCRDIHFEIKQCFKYGIKTIPDHIVYLDKVECNKNYWYEFRDYIPRYELILVKIDDSYKNRLYGIQDIGYHNTKYYFGNVLYKIRYHEDLYKLEDLENMKCWCIDDIGVDCNVKSCNCVERDCDCDEDECLCQDIDDNHLLGNIIYFGNHQNPKKILGFS